ncbi:PNPNAS-117 protein-like [Scleropages formosus]|uniref:PNPNAS-117 protein-like n=1 Tax=Scleropages formosus TaxID=113540 RepID=A0A0P7VCF3_SCLFO|nr:PNPNAS-117 protein-like [Scleropages formosus]
MGLGNVWRQYRVLIVMSASLGLIHWGWFQLKGHPALHGKQQREDDEYIPEPAIVSYVASGRQSGGK